MDELAEFAARVRDFDGRSLLYRLQDDPDDETVDEALNYLRALRGMLDKEKATFQLARRLRGVIVSTLTTNRPEMKMATIATAAGFNSSMASKVAKKFGAAPRTHRPSRQRS